MLNNSGDDFNFKNMFQQFSLLELYFYVDTNSLQVLYNILMETSSHEKPMKEFYRRRNEIPEEIGNLYPFMGSTLVDPYQNDGNSNNVVIGLNNAVKKVKEEIATVSPKLHKLLENIEKLFLMSKSVNKK